MITLYPYETLGNVDHGWLNAHHHFSFARYWNPDRTHFGTLRVINDDIIAAGSGFGTHPHNNMEIITYVREGAISHKDSLGNAGRTEAGDVQVMSAGSGIAHSEFNAESVDTRLYQIWIEPNEQNVKPRWETRQFPKTPVTDSLHVLVSGNAESNNADTLYIHQDAFIYGGILTKGTTIEHPIKHQAYILVSQGEISVDGTKAKKGDGLEVTKLKKITLSADSDAEVLIIDIPV